jgi:hypothetical protein
LHRLVGHPRARHALHGRRCDLAFPNEEFEELLQRSKAVRHGGRRSSEIEKLYEVRLDVLAGDAFGVP